MDFSFFVIHENGDWVQDCVLRRPTQDEVDAKVREYEQRGVQFIMSPLIGDEGSVQVMDIPTPMSVPPSDDFVFPASSSNKRSSNSVTVPKRAKQQRIDGTQSAAITEEELKAIPEDEDAFWHWVAGCTDWPLSSLLEKYEIELHRLEKRWKSTVPQPMSTFTADEKRAKCVRNILATTLRTKQRECLMLERLLKMWRDFNHNVYRFQFGKHLNTNGT